MKISKKKKSSKKNIVIGVIVALLVVGVAAAIYFFNTQRNSSKSSDINPVNTVSYDAPTNEEKTQTDEQKEQIINNYNESLSKTGESDSTNGAITVSVNWATQSASTISIGTLVEGAKSGTCEISLSKDGQPTITKTFDIVYEAASSRCNNVSFPLSDLSEDGEWLITAIAKNGTSTSEPATFKQSFYKS